ncbi:hypothetical protein Tco_0458871 [Tanacetum coccineum]
METKGTKSAKIRWQTNVPAQPPTRTDEQLYLALSGYPSGKATFFQRTDPDQKNPIFKYHGHPEWCAENTKKTPQGIASVQPATQRATPKKPATTTPVKQTKPAPSPTKKPSKRKLPQKIRKRKPTFQLVNEEDEARQDDDPDLDLAKKLSLESHQEKGEEEGRAPIGGVTIRSSVQKPHPNCMKRDQTPPDSTTGPSSQPDDDTSEKVIHESSSTSDSERTESETEAAAPKGDQYQGEVIV